MYIFSYDFIRKTLLNTARHAISIFSLIRRKHYACRALSGESSYNIAINSDFTVSCNCTDYYKKGEIGDLHTHSFETIFHGEKAEKLRKQLSKGKLPLLQCVLCMDRMQIQKAEISEYITNYRLPYKGMMMENSIFCNLHCVSCPRESILQKRSSKRLSLDQVESIAMQIKKMNLQSLAYFNLGEPFFYDSIFDELSIIKKHNPSISIFLSTNGSMVDTDRKRDAAMLLQGMCFSIDGIDNETANKYQRGIDFNKSYENLKKMVAYRDAQGSKNPTIEWKYVLFKWNDKDWMIEKAIELAKEANVDKITFWPTLSPPWSASLRWYRGKLKNIGVPFPNGRVVHFT